MSENKEKNEAETLNNLKAKLVSAIMELTYDERKELLAMWKGRKTNGKQNPDY